MRTRNLELGTSNRWRRGVIRQRNQLRIRRLRQNIINMSKILKSYNEAEQLTGLSRDRLQYFAHIYDISTQSPDPQLITLADHSAAPAVRSSKFQVPGSHGFGVASPLVQPTWPDSGVRHDRTRSSRNSLNDFGYFQASSATLSLRKRADFFV